MHQDRPVSQRTFEVVMWALTATATLFLASRIAVRILTKGKLLMNDYFLIPTFLCLWIGVGLLQSTLPVLYHPAASTVDSFDPGDAVRLTAAIEMLWIAIYFVKFCFLAQFNFHQPPYSYVSIHLTRYYWISVGTCLVAFSISIIQPIVLCHSQKSCRYFNRANNLSWENAITIVDIFSTIQVPSILIPLIYMANLSRRRAVINIIFKGLFAVTIGIATLRLVLQYDGQGLRLDYVVITFWLIVEAVISLITMSISSYRAVVLDMLSSVDSQPREFLNPINVLNGTQVIQNSSPLQRKCTISRSNGESLSEIPMLQPP